MALFRCGGGSGETYTSAELFSNPVYNGTVTLTCDAPIKAVIVSMAGIAHVASQWMYFYSAKEGLIVAKNYNNTDLPWSSNIQEPIISGNSVTITIKGYGSSAAVNVLALM